MESVRVMDVTNGSRIPSLGTTFIEFQIKEILLYFIQYGL